MVVWICRLWLVGLVVVSIWLVLLMRVMLCRKDRLVWVWLSRVCSILGGVLWLLVLVRLVRVIWVVLMLWLVWFFRMWVIRVWLVVVLVIRLWWLCYRL